MAGTKGHSGGSNRKSLREHLLAGSYRFDRHGEVPAELQHMATGKGRLVPFRAPEPAAEPTTPRCPVWLSEDAKRAWRRMVPALRQMGVLTVVDGDALASYCVAYARWRQCEKFLDEHGMTYALRDERGKVRGVKPHPQVGIARNLVLIMRSFMQEFRMTPASRGVEFENFLQVPPQLVDKPPEDGDREPVLDRKGNPI